jgi:excisionase family DNA binding protein
MTVDLVTKTDLNLFVEAVAVRTVELLKNSISKSEYKKCSVKDIASKTGLSELTIRNYINEGKIIAQRIGGRILIDEAQFEAGLEEVKSLKYKR